MKKILSLLMFMLSGIFFVGCDLLNNNLYFALKSNNTRIFENQSIQVPQLNNISDVVKVANADMEYEIVLKQNLDSDEVYEFDNVNVTDENGNVRVQKVYLTAKIGEETISTFVQIILKDTIKPKAVLKENTLIMDKNETFDILDNIETTDLGNKVTPLVSYEITGLEGYKITSNGLLDVSDCKDESTGKIIYSVKDATGNEDIASVAVMVTNSEIEFDIFDGEAIRIGNYINNIGYNTSRHWVANENTFVANTESNCDWLFGYSYSTKDWNKYSVDKGLVMVLDSEKKIMYVAIYSTNNTGSDNDDVVNVTYKYEDSKLVKGSFEGKDLFEGINDMIPEGGHVIFANDLNTSDWPNIPRDIAKELSNWDEEDFANNEIVFPYDPDEDNNEQTIILDSGIITIGSYSVAIGYNTTRHWEPSEEGGFVANTQGNCDWIFGYSYANKEYNDYTVDKGAVIVLDENHKILYVAIVSKADGKDINIVYKVENEKVIKGIFEGEDLFAEAKEILPKGGFLAFANDFGPYDVYPNIPQIIAEELSKWSDASFIKNSITISAR